MGHRAWRHHNIVGKRLVTVDPGFDPDAGTAVTGPINPMSRAAIRTSRPTASTGRRAGQ